MKLKLNLFIGFSIFSLGFPSFAAPAPGGEPRRLTLEEAVSLGLKNATSVLRATNETERSGNELLQGYGQFLPNLVATGSYSYSQGNNFVYTGTPTLVAGSSYGPTTQIGTTLNIFNGLSDFGSLKAALERKDAANMSLARAKQQIVIDVTQSYLQIVLDSHIVDIADKNLASSTERQKLLREQTRVGVRNLADLYRQEAQTSADESFLIISQNKRRDDEILLLRKIRLEVAGKYQFDEPPLEPPAVHDTFPSSLELIRVAMAKRADYKASRATAQAFAWDVTKARLGYFPRLDLGFNVYQTGRYLSSQTVNGVNVVPQAQDGIWAQLGEHTNYAIGLTLTWNIFDRFLTHSQVEQAHVKADNAERDYDDARLQIEGEIRKVLGDYRGAIQQLDTSLKGSQAAEAAYETVKGRYQVGAASFVDLITAQSALVQAQTNRVQAQTDFILQRRLVDFYTGTTSVSVK